MTHPHLHLSVRRARKLRYPIPRRVRKGKGKANLQSVSHRTDEHCKKLFQRKLSLILSSPPLTGERTKVRGQRVFYAATSESRKRSGEKSRLECRPGTRLDDREAGLW